MRLSIFFEEVFRVLSSNDVELKLIAYVGFCRNNARSSAHRAGGGDHRAGACGSGGYDAGRGDHYDRGVGVSSSSWGQLFCSHYSVSVIGYSCHDVSVHKFPSYHGVSASDRVNDDADDDRVNDDDDDRVNDDDHSGVNVTRSWANTIVPNALDWVEAVKEMLLLLNAPLYYYRYS